MSTKVGRRIIVTKLMADLTNGSNNYWHYKYGNLGVCDLLTFCGYNRDMDIFHPL